MTTVLEAPAPTLRPASRESPARWWGTALFATLFTLYFTVGAVLTLRYNLFDPDSPSRVANAGYVFSSRDPHLSAIGFVWNPLPSLVEIPVLRLAAWWPELKTYGLAGVVQSALFMAGAAVLVRRIAFDRSVGGGWRWLAVAVFALNPMVVIYGSSGMSEAAEVFCALWATRYLLLWARSRSAGDLAWVGIALGVGYLARYEIVTAACGVAALVAITCLVRSPRADRWANATLHVVIVLFPITVAFVTWAVTGWLVSDELFATLSSQYGNDSQIAAAVARGGPQGRAASADWVVIAARLLGMQPFTIVAVAGAAMAATLTRKLDHLAPLAVYLPILGFAAWGQYSSTTFGWFRFYLLAIPLVTCIALTCWNASRQCAPTWRTGTVQARLGAALLCGSLVVGFPMTISAMLNQNIGNQQLQFGFRSILDPQRYPADEQWYRRLLVNDRQLAKYFDGKHLPEGSVLMDTFTTWGIWLASDDPKQFVITSDYDFKPALNRPRDFGIQYVIVNNPALTNADAINQRYPQMWRDGAGIGSLVFTVNGATGDERFRVYRVIAPSAPA